MDPVRCYYCRRPCAPGEPPRCAAVGCPAYRDRPEARVLRAPPIEPSPALVADLLALGGRLQPCCDLCAAEVPAWLSYQGYDPQTGRPMRLCERCYDIELAQALAAG